MQLLDNRYSTNCGIDFHHTISPIDQISQNKENLSHSHPHFEIYYLVKGEVYYHVAGQKYRVDEGSLLLLNTFCPHKVEVMPSSICDRYVLEFTMDYIPTINGICPAYYFFEKRHAIKILPKAAIEQTRVLEVFKQIENEALHQTDFSAHVILGHIFEILSIACLADSSFHEEKKAVIQQEENRKFIVYINEATQYINANIDKKVSIDEIAEHIHISRSYLQHIFKKCMGISLSDYIFKQKMHSAKAMLAGGKTFSETASALGYKYYSTFSADYKKLFGVSPKQDKYSNK